MDLSDVIDRAGSPLPDNFVASPTAKAEEPQQPTIVLNLDQRAKSLAPGVGQGANAQLPKNSKKVANKNS